MTLVELSELILTFSYLCSFEGLLLTPIIGFLIIYLGFPMLSLFCKTILFLTFYCVDSFEKLALWLLSALLLKYVVMPSSTPLNFGARFDWEPYKVDSFILAFRETKFILDGWVLGLSVICLTYVVLTCILFLRSVSSFEIVFLYP